MTEAELETGLRRACDLLLRISGQQSSEIVLREHLFTYHQYSPQEAVEIVAALPTYQPVGKRLETWMADRIRYFRIRTAI